MRKNKVLRILHSVLIIFILLLQSHCIHTNSQITESIAIKSAEKSTSRLITSESVKIDYVIYHPAKFPLTTFFRRLTKGEFTEAFKRFNLKYESANISNELLQELISHGFIPAYIQIKNIGPRGLKFSPTQLHLFSKDFDVPAIPYEEIPRALKQFNPEAFAANIYNVSVTIIGSVGLLAALTMANGPNSGGAIFPTNESLRYYDQKILNETQQTVQLDFREELLREQSLVPNASIRGLVFFRLEPNQIQEETELRYANH